MRSRNAIRAPGDFPAFRHVHAEGMFFGIGPFHKLHPRHFRFPARSGGSRGRLRGSDGSGSRAACALCARRRTEAQRLERLHQHRALLREMGFGTGDGVQHTAVLVYGAERPRLTGAAAGIFVEQGRQKRIGRPCLGSGPGDLRLREKGCMANAQSSDIRLRALTRLDSEGLGKNEFGVIGVLRDQGVAFRFQAPSGGQQQSHMQTGIIMLFPSACVLRLGAARQRRACRYEQGCKEAPVDTERTGSMFQFRLSLLIKNTLSA